MFLFKESVFYLACQTLSFGLSIITDILLSRSIGPAGRGVFSTVTTTVILTASIAIFGMGYSPTYLLAKKKASLSQVHTAVLVFILFMSFIAIVVYKAGSVLLTGKVGEVITQYWGFIVFFVPLELYKQAWFAILIGINKVAIIGKTIVATASVGTVSMWICLQQLNLGLKGAFSALAATYIITTSIMVYRIYRLSGLTIGFKRNILREAVAFSIMAHVGNIAVQVYQRLGIFILGHFFNMTTVGYYTLSLSLAEKELQPLNSIVTAANYRIIGDKNEDSFLLICKTLRVCTTILIAECIIIFSISKWVIPLLYGSVFLPAVTSLLIIAPGVALFGLSSIVASYFSGQLGKPKICTAVALITMLFSIPLYYFMIKLFGLIGASFGTSLICATTFLLLVSLFKYSTKAKLRDMFIISWAKDIKHLWVKLRQVS